MRKEAKKKLPKAVMIVGAGGKISIDDNRLPD